MDFSTLSPKKQVKIQHWLKVIHDCRASGMTNLAFCEQNGIYKKLLLLNRIDQKAGN